MNLAHIKAELEVDTEEGVDAPLAAATPFARVPGALTTLGEEPD